MKTIKPRPLTPEQIKSLVSRVALETRAMDNPTAWKKIRQELTGKGLGKGYTAAEQLIWKTRKQLREADKEWASTPAGPADAG